MSQNAVTVAEDTAIPSGVWEPSPSEGWAAALLAQLKTQTQVAHDMNVDIRTIQRYWANPPFRELVRSIQRGILEGYFEEFQFRIAESLIIMGQVFRGEVPPDDGRVALAQDTLKSTLYRMATSGDLIPGAVPVSGELPTAQGGHKQFGAS